MRFLNSLRLAYHSALCAFWHGLYHFAFDQCINHERRHSQILCSEIKIKPSKFSR